MDQKQEERLDDPVQETPEDVAALYTWANLRGAKYRDFSASRREYRAQMRYHAAEQQRDIELRAQAEAETAAAAAEKASHEAEEIARKHAEAARLAEGSGKGNSAVQEAARARAMRAAAEMARRASMQRIEAARRAEAVAAAEAAARREEREIAEAHASAQRQAARYEASESRLRDLTGPQPGRVLGGPVSDPYAAAEGPSRPDRVFHQPVVPRDDMQPSRHRQTREARSLVPQPASDSAERPMEYWMDARPQREPSPADAVRSAAQQRAAAREEAAEAIEARAAAAQTPAQASPVTANSAVASTGAPMENPPAGRRPQGYRPDEASGMYTRPVIQPLQEEPVPAWIHSQSQELSRTRPAPPAPVVPTAPAAETLVQSREKVASRWYALRGVFDQGQDHEPAAEAAENKELRAPMMSVFSLAGGVGKTSLVATLGRALSATGEKVLLADMTAQGLLPFYFGASQLRLGVVRTFSPPAGSPDAPIYMVSYDLSGKTGDTPAQDWLSEEILQSSKGVQRVLLDLGSNAAWVARRLARMNSQVLVPLAPDMNSVISLRSVEKFFSGMVGAEGHPLQPYYMLNQFDASMPLHLDVREVLQKQLGERLLPFVVRRSNAVSEALAEGMTVMDYAPESAVANDYAALAAWLKTQSAPAVASKTARWSEQ